MYLLFFNLLASGPPSAAFARPPGSRNNETHSKTRNFVCVLLLSFFEYFFNALNVYKFKQTDPLYLDVS